MSFTAINYKVVSNSNDLYMNFQEGENKFRILSDAIVGWEDWKDKKPLRFRFDKKPAFPVDPQKPIKGFWAMIVWNYTAKRIQILQIKQASVIKAIEGLIKDEDWGQPFFYDIKVTKSGDGMLTKYVVNPVSHKEVAKEVVQAYKAQPIWLEALYEGLDPFAEDYKTYTAGIFSKSDIKEPTKAAKPAKEYEVMSDAQAYELEDLLSACQDTFSKKVYEGMNSRYGSMEAKDWPASHYEELKLKCVKNKAQFGLKDAM